MVTRHIEASAETDLVVVGNVEVIRHVEAQKQTLWLEMWNKPSTHLFGYPSWWPDGNTGVLSVLRELSRENIDPLRAIVF